MKTMATSFGRFSYASSELSDGGGGSLGVETGGNFRNPAGCACWGSAKTYTYTATPINGLAGFGRYRFGRGIIYRVRPSHLTASAVARLGLRVSPSGSICRRTTEALAG